MSLEKFLKAAGVKIDEVKLSELESKLSEGWMNIANYPADPYGYVNIEKNYVTKGTTEVYVRGYSMKDRLIRDVYVGLESAVDMTKLKTEAEKITKNIADTNDFTELDFVPKFLDEDCDCAKEVEVKESADLEVKDSNVTFTYKITFNNKEAKDFFYQNSKMISEVVENAVKFEEYSKLERVIEKAVKEVVNADINVETSSFKFKA